jgi:two-component system response regulator YesN
MSYNLLLVDDEIHAVEGVKTDLDLDKLRIDRLFIAYNAKQAQEFFEQERIDIMLCDIEMPQGSGLELTRWVKERGCHTVTIFLTSHADFRYAKEALKLGSLDYLLKPVVKDDLEQVILKAQEEIDRSTEYHRISQSHQLWLKHHSLIFERFWLDLINHTIPANRAAIREQIELHQLPISEDSMFLPILIAVQRWNKELTRRDEKIMEYAIKNCAEEIFLKHFSNGMFFYLDRGVMMGIFSIGTQENYDQERLKTTCQQYIVSCNQYFYCNISCYIGQPVLAHQMAEQAAELRQLNHNNVAYLNQVYVQGQIEPEIMQEGIELPELGVWMSLLKAGTREEIISEVEKFLDELVKKQAINAAVLNQIHQDLMQVIYSFLNAEGIQAYKLFGDEHSVDLALKASRSVRDLKAWVQHTVNKAIYQAETVQQGDSVVQMVQRYIAQNIDKELTREALAEMVYLNPDHLTRLFKRETGLSVSEYILAERIRLAKKMLTQTDIPISSIAISVGHTNFSHFARIFRKYVGLGPSEYRNQLAKNKELIDGQVNQSE